MTARLKVAVVGAGGWGEQHARIFAQRPDTDLVAVAGRTPQRTADRAAAYGTRPYTDLTAMVETERPDLITVSLPNEGHFEPTLELIRLGVPLLVEKPLVFDLAEADQLIAEAAERDLFFGINFNHRYAEPVLRARKAIADGALGDLVFATWRFGGEPNFGTSPHANLIETQCHGFDLLEHLCGPITSVAAQMTDKTRTGVYTTLAVALGFADGAVGSLVGSYDSSYAYPGTQLVELNGTAGRALIEDTVARLTLQSVGDETRHVWQAGYFNDAARQFHLTFDRHVDAVLAALRDGAQPPVHARAGRRALALATAVIESFETGRRVAVPAGDPS
ncbi:Gfo/Idh/MocA family oxidoreductase [Dactylosporangium sp. NPDC005555]|uniref:Gfo/Idh/MocA family protein n=1 Tax=Dactylosporangium sp. NPDC005555 TaxID=3154889 RepID=UPI0033AFCA53